MDTKFNVGDIVRVEAWWQQNRTIKCRICSLNSFDSELVGVSPLEGNPHSRFVHVNKILEISNGTSESR